LKLAIFSAILIATASQAMAQQSVTEGPYTAQLITPLKSIPVGESTTLEVSLIDSVSKSVRTGLVVTAKLSMPAMAGMMLDEATVVAGTEPGQYGIRVNFPHPGVYLLAISVRDRGGKEIRISFMLNPGSDSESGMMNMGNMLMKATLGRWSANREGSGTAWQPDSTPMYMLMLPSLGGFELSLMGSIQAGFVDSGGKRGDKAFFSNSMIMLMGRKEIGKGTIGLRLMTSADPEINGQFGVPNLFQTGETANGRSLVDRQHPHNLYSELAMSYAQPLSRGLSGFVYGGPVGEPALGNVMFMHRASGMEVPEAPIGHHWFDSTHISFGVVTAGLVFQNRWKVEASAFNGHEPGENRYELGPIALNSAAGRLSFNPSSECSFSASYGFLDSPEALSPGVSEHRATVSAAYSHAFTNGDTIAATGTWGQNVGAGPPTRSNGYLAETTYFRGANAIFARYEQVEKNELANVPVGNYKVHKLLFGNVHTFLKRDGLDYGFGVYGGVYAFPSSLKPIYGSSPLTVGVYLRLRPTRM
jgi:YtkA-like